MEHDTSRLPSWEDTARSPAVLDEVNVGSRWRSAGRTLSEAELSWACNLSGDWHPIHADAAYAAKTRVGQRLFHGGYGILLCLGAAAHFPDLGARSAVALGIDAWKFTAPLFVGDTVYVEVEITGLRRTSDGGRVVMQKRIRLVKDSGQTVQEGTAASLVHLSIETGEMLAPEV